MRKQLKRLGRRKSVITREELSADAIFLFISGFISAVMVFLFDIHQSFYNWPITLKFLFGTPYPYFIFISIGTFVGFFVIKLLLLGFKEEGA